jgi:prepilin-type N-terminal cleavage/methylation domain-containing protein
MRGFTLIEILVVIAIFGILSFIGFALIGIDDAPCENYQNVPFRSIPARCLQYYGITSTSL